MEPWEYAEIDYINKDIDRCENCGADAPLTRGYCAFCIIDAMVELTCEMGDMTPTELERATDTKKAGERLTTQYLFDVAADFIADNFEFKED